MSIERTQRLPAVSSIHPRENPIDLPLKARKVSISQPATRASEVQLSDAQARLMQPGPEDIDMSRVDFIKQAISKGELQVNPEKIADALLQEAKCDKSWLSAAENSAESHKG